jgi:extracellular factor (EF) 3-hydroxypalmitic acid methyl ester biosynthesis protein
MEAFVSALMATVPRSHFLRRRYWADRETRKVYDELFQGFFSDVHATLSQTQDQKTVHSALDDLFLALRERRQHATPEEWQEFVELCRQHPVRGLLHQDLFTERAYSKPRGYAGDAVLLDYIYGREEMWPPPAMSRLGRLIYDYTTSAPASAGVRARRGFAANLIDKLAEERPGLEVLSIAAGHLREAALAAAVRRRRLGRFTALDGDRESLTVVQDTYGPFGVEVVPARISRLISQRLSIGRFDLVYSLGLFDYVDQPLGRRLVSSMFDLLRPGGCLVVANFMPGIRDVGYMETFMDWQLIYRTRHEMVDLTMDIPQSNCSDIRIFAEETQNIIFLQVTRSS